MVTLPYVPFLSCGNIKLPYVNIGTYLSFFLYIVFFRIKSGLIVFTVELVVLITDVSIICGKIVFSLIPLPPNEKLFCDSGSIFLI